MANHFKYIIIGGGLAGASAIEGIRAHDSSGSIALFGKEHHLPYDRPPLSKGLWSGKITLDKLPVHDKAFYTRHSIHLYLGNEITGIESQKKQIIDSEKNHYGFEKLLIATGGSPRALSFGGDAIQYFRTMEDYQTLHDIAERKEEFIILGGGFIGAELAAALCMKKKKVTMIFPDEFLLEKILPRDLAANVTEYYQAKGINILSNDLPTSVEKSDGATRVATKNGKRLTGDLALAAIGLNLHTEMFARAGIKVENGISVNSVLQTSDPNVFAAGDVAFFPAPSLDKSIRIEHWNNAQAQGKCAGENMAGAKTQYEYLPYFYSDLFDLGFEAVGDLNSRLQTFADWKEEFREGTVYYFDDEKLKGVLLWNVWEKVDAARALINRKKTYRNMHDVRGKL